MYFTNQMHKAHLFHLSLQLSLPLLFLLLVLAHADTGRGAGRGRRGRQRGQFRRNGRAQQFQQQPRRGRQQSLSQYGSGGNDVGGGVEAVPGGVDFSDCQTDETGMCCVYKESTVQSIQKEPVLECNHKNVEKCHYTYVTQFEPAQEEVCEENFEKTCQITFKQVATQETVQKCLTPLRKVCDQGQPQYGQPQYGGGNGNGGGGNGGEEECRTFYESSCTTRYIEKQPGKFVGDTQCEKQPVELCGQGCRMEQGEPECHDKEITSLLDVPEEVCDLNPQKTCRFVTRLVPRLKPEHECTIIPQEICNLKFSAPKQVDKPLKSKWCIDPNAGVERDEGGYDEGQAAAAPIGYNAAESAPPVYSQPAPSAPTSYATPVAPPPPAPVSTSYAQPASTGYDEPSGNDVTYDYEYTYDDLDIRGDDYLEPASDSYSQPAADNYGPPQSPPPSTYGQPQSPPPSTYGQPQSPPPSTYGQPQSPPPSNYGQPATDTYSQPPPSSYGSQPAEAPSSYAQPEPALPSYSQPAQPSYSQQPAAPAYSQPQPVPAQTSYSEPAPSSYSEPAADSYSQPAQPALPAYSSNGGPKPTPGPVYYKPVSEPELPTYGKRIYKV